MTKVTPGAESLPDDRGNLSPLTAEL